MVNPIEKLIIAWDLDGTIIDSSHRSTKKPDGSYDVERWREMSTEENIEKDSLLPLVDVFYEFQKTGYRQIAVTARFITELDLQYLKRRNIHFDMILHRHDAFELDEVLKERKIQEYLNTDGRLPFMAFDDKQENLEVFDRYGFRTFNAKYMNAKLLAQSYDEIKDKKPKDF